jgi:pimeloyl-ACP methyl ester carboxylesterase
MDVLLLHAFPCDGSLWSDVADRLRGQGHRVRTPDLLGFGLADPALGTPGLGVVAEEVLALVDGPIALGGVSLGGYVAMEILRRRPEVVSHLMLVDTKATADSDAARVNRERVARLADAEEPWAEGMLAALLGPRTITERPDVVARVERWIEVARPETVAWMQRAMAVRPDSRETLRGFHRSALVLWGADDVLSPPDEQHLMIEDLPHAISRQLPDVGHLTPVEAPEAVAEAMVDFLRQT